MSKIPAPLTFDDPALEIALFRHSLIATLIHHPPDSGRLEAELRHLAAQKYVIPHSRRTRVSVASLRRYLQAYRTHGFEALLPKPRCDKGRPQAFDPAVLQQAIALREQQPGRTTPMLVEILKREGHAVNAHTLDTHLRQAGKTRRLLRAQPQPTKRFEREHVNALWQSDASHGPWLPDPTRPGHARRTHLIAFLDDHSRLVPYGEFFFDEALPRLERVLKVALLRRGVPAALYVDNGQIFNATQFRAACASLRIEVIFASPYHPQGKGKIEQFWHLVQESFYPEVAASKVADLATLNQSFWAWLHGIYHARAHGETGQTPLDRFLAGADHLRAADPETVRLAFLWRTRRTVTRQATLNLQGNVYSVDPAWCGQVIELRYDPFDLTRMEVYRAGVRLGTARLTQTKRQRHLAVEHLVPEARLPAAPAPVDFLKTLREEHEAALRHAEGDSAASASPNSNQPPIRSLPMFTQLYGLQTTPFTRTLNTDDILATASVKELHARLALTVRERGIALVTGEVGSGKSTAVRAFLAGLDPNRHTVLALTLPLTSPSALYRQLLMALNQPIPFGATAQIAAVRAALADLIQTQRKTPVIVLDEAHLLGHNLIDPLRTLLSAQLDSQSLAALILIGQPELRRKLQLSTHAAFAQRVTHRCHLEPLPLEATLAYIQHHLKVAGLKDGAPLFSDDALKRIAEWAQGLPRRINQLCTAALIAGAVAKVKVIDDTPVRQAIYDLERE